MKNDECPACGADDFEDGGVDRTRVGDMLYLAVICHCACGQSWTLAESFKLTGFTIGIKDDAGVLELTHIASVGDEDEDKWDDWDEEDERND